MQQGGGKGWPSYQVAIDWHWSNSDRPGGGEMLITHDADTFENFSNEIDELIEELEAIRKQGRRKYTEWQKADIF